MFEKLREIIEWRNKYENEKLFRAIRKCKDR